MQTAAHTPDQTAAAYIPNGLSTLAAIELKDLAPRRPAVVRGVRAHAADVLSRLERTGAYLPI